LEVWVVAGELAEELAEELVEVLLVAVVVVVLALEQGAEAGEAVELGEALPVLVAEGVEEERVEGPEPV
jgi:hypothetical protein